MLHDDALDFTWLGTYLERADNTARILDARFEMLAAEAANSDDAGDYYEWSALLRSVSAFEIYRKVYRDLITPRRVAELLILREGMPRSLRHCMSRVHQVLAKVANERSARDLASALARSTPALQYGAHRRRSGGWTARATSATSCSAPAMLGARIASDFLVSDATG
jgi:uncharacterized alpha-E superfamily protein